MKKYIYFCVLVTLTSKFVCSSEKPQPTPSIPVTEIKYSAIKEIQRKAEKACKENKPFYCKMLRKIHFIKNNPPPQNIFTER